MKTYEEILQDSVFAIMLMNNKVIRVKYKVAKANEDNDVVKFIVPAYSKFQPKHIREFYKKYEENLKKEDGTKIRNMEEFYEKMVEN